MTIDLGVLSAPARPARGRAAVSTWCELEERYLQGRYEGLGGFDTVALTPGPAPVLLSAGHAVTHLRNGSRKAADIATGGLADTLAALTGAWSLTTTGMPAVDPNYDPPGTFKAVLDQSLPQVRAVLDLHGMKDTHGPDVCLGRGAQGKLADPLVTVIAVELTRAGFQVSVDDPFLADGEHTVTSSVQRLGVPAVQLELARRLRDPWEDPQTASRVLDALARAIDRVAG